MRTGITLVGSMAALSMVLCEGLGETRARGEDASGIRVYLPSRLKWTQGPASIPPGAKLAILEGDPNKEGPFVMRLQFPDGYRIAPHTHPKPERVTVIAGTLHVGMGEKFDPKMAQEMPAGTFGTWPAGMKHFGWTEGETIIQLHGIGPWSIKYVNPADDPRNGKKK